MLIGLLLSAGLYAILFSTERNGKPMNTNSILIFIAIFGGLMAFAFFNGLRRQKQFLEHYKLTIDDNVITREQHNTEELTIYFHEVKEIYKNKEGGFVIRGYDKTDIINIPAQVENYEALEAQLNQVMPITTESLITPPLQKWKPLISLVGFISLLVAFWGHDKTMVAICGIITVASYGWNIYETRISKNVDKKTKNMLWTSVLVLLLVIYTVISKVFLH